MPPPAAGATRSTCSRSTTARPAWRAPRDIIVVMTRPMSVRKARAAWPAGGVPPRGCDGAGGGSRWPRSRCAGSSDGAAGTSLNGASPVVEVGHRDPGAAALAAAAVHPGWVRARWRRRVFLLTREQLAATEPRRKLTAAEAQRRPTAARKPPEQEGLCPVTLGAVHRHHFRREPSACARLHRRRLPAELELLGRTCSGTSTGAAPAPRTSSTSVASRTRSASFRACSGPHHRHADRPAGREHRRALARLRQDRLRGPLPSRPRRLHLPAEAASANRGGGRSSAHETVDARRRRRDARNTCGRGSASEIHGRPRQDRLARARSREAGVGLRQPVLLSPDPSPGSGSSRTDVEDPRAGGSLGRVSPWSRRGVPPALAKPVFDRLDADLALRDDGHQRGQERSRSARACVR